MAMPASAFQAFVATRIAVFLVAYAGLQWFAMPLGPGTWRVFPDALWLDGWVRFDAAWYWSIIDRGYDVGAPGMANVAFFPLYPLVTAAVSTPLALFMTDERAYFAAGVLVANAAFPIALVGVYRLSEARSGHRAAAAAVWLVATFPFAMFFSAAYTESLYLALAVWSFVMAERGRWGAAGVLAAACALTRVPGILVGAALFVQHVRRQGGHRLLPLAAAPLAVLGLMAYFWWNNGDPLAFARVQEHWGRTGLDSLLTDIRMIAADVPADVRLLYGCYLVLSLIAFALLVPVWRRLGPGYALLTFVSLVLPLSSGLQSMGRYIAVMFPLFLVAGDLAPDRRRLIPVLIVFAVLQALFAYWLANWHLVT